MKLKKLAIKFLTMALSLLTLFQVGCGWSPYVSYYNFFRSFEEVKSFLENDVLWFFGEVNEPEEDLIFMHPIIDFAKLYTIINTDMAENNLVNSSITNCYYRIDSHPYYHDGDAWFKLTSSERDGLMKQSKFNRYARKVAPKTLLIEDCLENETRWKVEGPNANGSYDTSCYFFGVTKYRNDPNISCDGHSFLKEMPTDKDYCDCMIDLFDLSKILKKGSDYVEKDLPLEVKQKEDGTFGYFWNNEEHTSCFFEEEKYILEVENCINTAIQTHFKYNTQEKEFRTALERIYNEVYTEEKLMQLSAKILNECVHIIYAEKSTWDAKTRTVDLAFTK